MARSTLRSRRRAIPAKLTAPSPTPSSIASPRSLNPSPVYAISPRAIQATPLPSPITTLITTTQLLTLTSLVTPQATAIGVTTMYTTGMPMNGTSAIIPTGSVAVTTAATISNSSGANLVIGLGAAASFSVLGITGFFIMRRKRYVGGVDTRQEGFSGLDMKKGEAMGNQMDRPYSSRFRM